MSNSIPAEPGTESVSTRVVSEVAAARGVSPVEMDPPLYDVIDPGALDALFAGRSGSGPGNVSFDYGGYDVTVKSDGRVDVRRSSATVTDSG